MSNPLHRLLPASGSLQTVLAQKPLQPFADETIAFVEAVSASILKDWRFRPHPELMALAFWMRRPRLLALQREMITDETRGVRLARGVVFHIAPGNVDTLFVYSWFLSLLMGNINIVRLSSRNSVQQNLLLELLAGLLEEESFRAIRERTLVVRYERDDGWSEIISRQVNMRVLWGGDETVAHLRSLPLPPRATELTFPDRFSLCALGVEAYLALTDKADLAGRFYNDAYWFGQMACSSPRVVFWIGEAGAGLEEARRLFWQELERIVDLKKPEWQPHVAMDKQVAAAAIGLTVEGVHLLPGGTAHLQRLWFEDPGSMPRERHCGGGLFFESRLADLDALFSWTRSKDQTVTLFGYSREAIGSSVRRVGPEGVDRIQRVGEALDFAPIWDGHDLLRAFSRLLCLPPAERKGDASV
ncbi:MAG: acyl-CoA reductase [Magnetococcales bacterium]|nr:acyl-CoA reductase [Magnetococcales bacterium]